MSTTPAINHWQLDAERQRQLDHGRQLIAKEYTTPIEKSDSLHRAVDRVWPSNLKRNTDLKGHMSFLGCLQSDGTLIRCVTVTGEIVTGKVKAFDDETISLRVDAPTTEKPNAYQTRVFIKRNLIEFAPLIDGVKFEQRQGSEK